MLDGKIVLLGSDHDAVTFFHYVEHVADICRQANRALSGARNGEWLPGVARYGGI